MYIVNMAYHHGDLRRALLDAALGLVEAEGPEAVTLRAVARAAGVSANAPYNHFDDKAALLAAVATETVDDLHDALVAAGATSAEPRAALHAIGLAYVRFATENPARFRLLGAPAIGRKTAHPLLAAAYARAFGVLVTALANGRRAGLVREAPVEELALGAWALVHGLATLTVDDQLAVVGGALAGEPSSVIATLFAGLRA